MAKKKGQKKAKQSPSKRKQAKAPVQQAVQPTQQVTEHVMTRKPRWHFLKPSIIKISLAILIFAIVVLWLFTPILSRTNAIPCKLGDIWTTCPVNPAAPEVSTIYLGAGILDMAYQIMYLLVFYIAFPYVVACLIVEWYHKMFNHG